MRQDDRKKAFNAAKSAVNAYAKDPSDKNAERVLLRGWSVGKLWIYVVRRP